MRFEPALGLVRCAGQGDACCVREVFPSIAFVLTQRVGILSAKKVPAYHNNTLLASMATAVGWHHSAAPVLSACSGAIDDCHATLIALFVLNMAETYRHLIFGFVFN